MQAHGRRWKERSAPAVAASALISTSKTRTMSMHRKHSVSRPVAARPIAVTVAPAVNAASSTARVSASVCSPVPSHSHDRDHGTVRCMQLGQDLDGDPDTQPAGGRGWSCFGCIW